MSMLWKLKLSVLYSGNQQVFQSNNSINTLLRLLIWSVKNNLY
ncbi:hypothetical protein yrohd0001_33310 [Yersinia rohdei ATCC 43380]|nr:hypothetical protein yrohd0001_33310 [Yersinia rohdei ATCC 43380]